MRKHLERAFDRLLKAKRTEADLAALFEEVSSAVLPVLQLQEQGRIQTPGADALELQLEFAILEAICSNAKKAVGAAESEAKDAASMYAQIKALRALKVDTEKGETDYEEAIDNCNMRTEEVHVLRGFAEECQRKVLALIPQL